MVVDRPADNSARVSVKDDAAVDLPFPGWVFGDVGQPQLVGRRTSELTADEILSGHDVGQAPTLLASREPFQRELAHQLVHKLARHDDLAAKP